MVHWIDNPVFGYAVQIATELRYCEVIMRDHAYEVVFRSAFAEIQLDDNLNWQLTAGVPLPYSIITEIGHRIESVYM
ncbi:hypothetical protein [Mucilaginibacter ginsenosidivorans]|uniref:Uncharacterized protein n=1 Tax=Mucilaginibacter ginsenosidivorans TaxID=398053 RepID=A0A5B8UU75_9SPHI|nr:hypothetical protein [Mucilaginibacter ginsenosidivorans]QEC62483.1 hypothetical protein FRZ54_07745 [Mucilaginibacter ginsenosidivorans]